MRRTITTHLLDHLPRLLTVAGLVLALALPTYLQANAAAPWPHAAADSAHGATQPRLTTELADAHPGCTARPAGLPDHLLVVTLAGEARTMTYAQVHTIHANGGQVWVVGYCSAR